MTIGALSFGFTWALLLLALLPVVFWLGWKRLTYAGRTRRSLILGSRLTLTALIILALADPRWLTPGGPKATVFLIDSSASTSNFQIAASTFVRAALGRMGPLDRGGVVAFGRQAIVLQPLGQTKDFQAGIVPNDDRTDLASALRLGASMLPRDGVRRLVVLSDGWETSGRAEDEVDRLAANGIVVDYIIPNAPAGGIAIKGIETPGQVRDGEPFDAFLQYESAGSGPASLTLSVDGQPGTPQQVTLLAGSNTLNLPVTATGEGFHRISASVVSGDGNPAVATGWFVAKPRPTTLIYEDRPGEGAALARALEAAGIKTETRLSGTVPTSPASLRVYDAIALANVSATALTLDQQKTLQSYVRDFGKGIAFVGGPNSFTLGDYGSSLLGEMLPVNADVPPKPEEGAFGLALVLDKSGSMDLKVDGVSKMQMVKEAGFEAVNLLRDDDYVTIVVFDSVTRTLLPPQKVGDNRGVPAIQARITGVQADGGTEIFPGLERGFQLIRETAARYKHVVLLSDGQSPSGEYDRLIRDMRAAKVTLSAIAVGSDADTALMSRLAKEGGGRYYFTERVRDVPRIMSRETSIAIGATTATGQVQPQLVGNSPILRGLVPAELPALASYAVTTPKDTAETILVSPAGDPLLAQWQYGSGRAVAFTSGFNTDWAGDWTAWSRLSQFWGQALRYAIGPPVDPGIAVLTETAAESTRITVEAINDNGTFVDLATVEGIAIAPSGQAVRLPIRQIAPGRYRADLISSEGGAHELRVRLAKQGIPDRNETVGFVTVTDPETRTLAPNDRLLRRLAGATGGRQISVPESAWADSTRTPGLTRLPLWPYLLGTALVLFVGDIAARRLRGIPRFWHRGG